MKKEMTEKQLGEALRNLQKFFKEQEKLDSVINVISPSGTMVVEFGNEFVDDYISLLASAVGDDDCWLNWFIFDNDFGSKGLKVVLPTLNKGRDFNVTSVRHLYRIIKSKQWR